MYIGDQIRMEIGLPNGNRLPLRCKAIYKFENFGVGIKFLDLTKFEQSLLLKIIVAKLEDEGVPAGVDPFTQPETFGENNTLNLADLREKREEMLEEVMSSD